MAFSRGAGYGLSDTRQLDKREASIDMSVEKKKPQLTLKEKRAQKREKAAEATPRARKK